ncbi:MAG: carbon-nitrogen hydrolase family protein [Deltaproteobacteria bacterium]|nr:carbon-nitrogen hydrolase family protein [Deltaproteobacteria bacterium]
MLAAVIQMNSGSDLARNLAQAEELLRLAAAKGAGLAVLPEHFSLLVPEGQEPANAQPLQGPLLAFLAGLARELDLWLVGGSFPEKVRGGGLYNTCPVLDPQGRLRAFYRKVHLFRLALPGTEPLDEARFCRPGRRLRVVDTPCGALGLSICYDLRFPELYRCLRLKGAEVLVAPSAFTKVTGQAHWELLLRARAVENAAFMLAAAQWGSHAPGRASYGRAMIVNPWGEILAECPPGTGLALAEVDPGRVAASRERLDSTPQARLLPAAWRGRTNP